MSPRPERVGPEAYVIRMYRHAKELNDLVEAGEVTPERLGRSSLVQLATVKALELVGEQASQLRRVGYDLGPDIDLAEMAGMRNRMVHHYEGTDWGVVQEATFEDIPRLVHALERFMERNDIHPFSL